MTNTVAAVSIKKSADVPLVGQAPVRIQKNADASVFKEDKVQPENADIKKEISDIDKAAKSKREGNSFLNTLKKIVKGGINGIKNIFSSVFDCPPMAFASIATLIGVSVGSEAILTLMLVSLGAIIIGSALSGITNEFRKPENGKG